MYIKANINFFEKTVGKKLTIFREGGIRGGTPSLKMIFLNPVLNKIYFVQNKICNLNKF